MNILPKVEAHLDAIRSKLALGANDFNMTEKEALREAYHELTTHSTGKGRTLDISCGSCVTDAANLVRNYLRATPTSEAPTGEAPTGEAPTGEAPTGEAPTGEAPTGEAPTGEAPTGEAPTGEAPTGEAPTGEAPELNKAQLCAIIKAKTGEEINPRSFTLEVLKIKANA